VVSSESRRTDRPLVLVADDEVEVAALVAISLHRAGFQVMTAANGGEALEHALAERPAACVFDIMMPNVNGYEVVRRLRQSDEVRTMPIVLLSARAGALDRDYGLRIGADAYVLKPFPPRELAHTVRTLIETRSAGAAALV
jgi:DNA-binding response OmpR family regulator